MTVAEFKQLFSDEVGAGGFLLTQTCYVFRQPLELWDSKTDESVKFDSIDELLSYEYNGQTVVERISKMDELVIGNYGGGRGDSSGEKTFKFSNAAGASKEGGLKSEKYPVEANLRIKTKTLEGAMQEFQEKHGNSDHEWAYEVDPQGYVHQYIEGDKHSVAISGKNKNNMILHNHPGGGNFSKADMQNVALGNERGIVAHGKNGMYIFEKNGGHFKANEFVKAINNARPKGKSYDDAIHKWLKANQQKYGYTYKWTNDKSKSTGRSKSNSPTYKKKKK